MSWTTPTVRATGDLITASIYNADLVNNLRAISGSTILTATLGSTASPISWTTEAVDDLNGWVIGAPTVFTAPWTGYYDVFLECAWTGASGTGAIVGSVSRAGTAAEKWAANEVPSVNATISCAGGGLLVATDTLSASCTFSATGTGGSVASRLVVRARGGQ